MCHERAVIQEKSMRSFVFPKQLNHIAPTKGLVSFGVVQTDFRIRLSSMSSGAGRKSRLFFGQKEMKLPVSAPLEDDPQYSSSLKKKSSLEG